MHYKALFCEVMNCPLFCELALFIQDRNVADEAKEKSSGLFDPTAEAFTSSFNVTVSLLVTAILIGLTYHYKKYMKGEKEKKKKLEALSK